MESLESLLKELDDHWQNGITPDLAEMLHRAGYPHDSGCVELCAADLEWRWQKPGREAKKHATGPSATLPLRPVAFDYQALIPDLWRIRRYRLQMMESEWIARCAWGDHPHFESFLKLWSADGVTMEGLMKKLQTISPLYLSVFTQGRCAVKAAAPPEFIIGRQRSAEPSSPAWIPSTRRLLIAGITDCRYSRNQVRIRRTRMREVCIENLSAKAETPLNYCILRPLESRDFPLPLQIVFEDIYVILEEIRGIPDG